MAEAIDEGVLYDLLTKRRAGRFTADDLLWVADHPTIIGGLRTGKLKTVLAVADEEAITRTVNVVSDWQKLLTACKQYWVNPDFTEARWPLEPVAVDEAEWKVEEHFFDDDATGTEKLLRLAEMVKRGEIRICGVRRAEEDTADHLDIQLDHPRIITVSALGSGGVLSLPAFHGRWFDGRERELFLYRVSNDFNRRCGWLVLRKRP